MRKLILIIALVALFGCEKKHCYVKETVVEIRDIGTYVFRDTICD